MPKSHASGRVSDASQEPISTPFSDLEEKPKNVESVPESVESTTEEEVPSSPGSNSPTSQESNDSTPKSRAKSR